MTRPAAIAMTVASMVLVGCASRQNESTMGTLAELREVEPDIEEIDVEHGLEQAMQHYREFLEESPETTMRPEAMRRLADLQLETQFGVRTDLAAPKPFEAPKPGPTPESTEAALLPTDLPGSVESEREFEQRTTTAADVLASDTLDEVDAEGPLEAIALYDELLAEYPNYEHRDKVLYQKARAYDELGRTDDAIATMDGLIQTNPHSVHVDEIQFRRGEYFFTRRQFRDAEQAYGAVIDLGDASTYYELALYKLGWTLYKQEFYEQALHRYIALLDHKVSTGYDFDGEHAEDEARRVEDTFRVVSLSLNNLGGPTAAPEYFAAFGHRDYEDRVYRNLGEHYLEKLRYADAAQSLNAFVDLYPFHRSAPQFNMRVIETFTAGSFPQLVLESKRDFASRYGLQAEYWTRFDPTDSPEVVAYLKSNLEDLATHYHALFQNAEEVDDNEDRAIGFREASRWYGDYLTAFPTDPNTPAVHYRLADLLLEHGNHGEAALAYESTAYDYPPHEQSAAAGYAAVYAYRRQLDALADDASDRDVVTRATVDSSLRFSDAFPDHEHAAPVLGAAADDLYELGAHGVAIATARQLLDGYAEAEDSIRRSAWTVVAHGSFDLESYPDAEIAYTQVLTMTPQSDETHANFVDNLAASIYKQGELANAAEDYRAAADHFLRVRLSAPTSTLRPTAEYDAGVALQRLEAWTEAAGVLEDFRNTYPDHELRHEATQQIANAYRESDDPSRAAVEYERVAAEADDPQLQGEALLVAGDLWESTDAFDRALEVYARYVGLFPRPVEPAVEVRQKIARIHKTAGRSVLYRETLSDIVRADAEAGDARTPRTRTLAARAALVLTEPLYDGFEAIELLQPFEESLAEKQRRMDEVIGAMENLVSYEIADVTAAATFYMAETYLEFSRALFESERPTDLEPTELAEYELVLEEEAFPFEERAIELHEENLELLQAGVFNDWTENSLRKLGEMVPGRYAKSESIPEDPDTLDRYVYRSPASRFVGPRQGTFETPVAAPPAAEDEEVTRAMP
ncbi:MAG: tetratricopeptide repeat protein [Acidobacteriota bacterium]|nr:tetratricopeptide repeat protein [Acidobacteriota bacterium]MDH3783697.1 tetratricopeptide repeat protein [Acidobacteriota bacterium]